MYIRRIARKNKNGSETAYLQLAHNKRDKISGMSRATVIHTFGREDQLDRDALKRLAESITRHLEPQDAMDIQAKLDGRNDIEYLYSKRYGGTWLLGGLWQQLDMKGIIDRLMRGRECEIDVERLIFAMVANRALAPKSKLGMEEWVDKDTFIPDLENAKSHQMYRAMDILMDMKDELERQVYYSVADLLNLEVDLIYFDTTSSYFEVEKSESGEDDFRKLGYSKDKRSDLTQVVIGLAVTREGIPIRSWVWPGNTADVSVVEEVKSDLVGWKLGRVISAMDRGFSSEENLRILQRTGGHYIIGERMRSGKPETEEALSRKGRYHEVRNNLMIKEVIVGDGECRKRYLLAYNPKEAEKQRKERETIISELTEELKHLKQSKDHTKAMCQLRSHKIYSKYLVQKKDGTLRINKAAIREAERYDGKYLIRTSDDTLSNEDVVLGYKQLIDVEDAFRTLKTELELRPMYHRVERRIRAHVLLCWLALLLVRMTEVKTVESWRKVRDEMERMQIGYFETPDGSFCQTTKISLKQSEYLSALGISKPQNIPIVLAKETQRP